MSSAICFNLGQSKTLSSVNGLTLLTCAGASIANFIYWQQVLQQLPEETMVISETSLTCPGVSVMFVALLVYHLLLQYLGLDGYLILLIYYE